MYGKWKSAQEYEPKGVTKLKRGPSSLRSSGLVSSSDEERSLGSLWSLGIRILVGCSIVKERVRRAGRKQHGCETDPSLERIVAY